MESIFSFFSNHGVDIVAILWTIDQLLKLVSKLTPWGWDDNISDILGSLLAKFFRKGQ